MRDAIDGRLWEAHHDQLSQSIGRFADAAGERLRRLGGEAGGAVLSVVALGFTLLTVAATAA